MTVSDTKIEWKMSFFVKWRARHFPTSKVGNVLQLDTYELVSITLWRARVPPQPVLTSVCSCVIHILCTSPLILVSLVL